MLRITAQTVIIRVTLCGTAIAPKGFPPGSAAATAEVKQARDLQASMITHICTTYPAVDRQMPHY